jgi:hypothetical protein
MHTHQVPVPIAITCITAKRQIPTVHLSAALRQRDSSLISSASSLAIALALVLINLPGHWDVASEPLSLQ